MASETIKWFPPANGLTYCNTPFTDGPLDFFPMGVGSYAYHILWNSTGTNLAAAIHWSITPQYSEDMNKASCDPWIDLLLLFFAAPRPYMQEKDFPAEVACLRRFKGKRP